MMKALFNTKFTACFASLMLTAVCLAGAKSAHAQFSLAFDSADFTVVNEFNEILGFDVQIDVAGPLMAGMIYANPTLGGVEYEFSGDLTMSGSPSGFQGFLLQRTIGGDEFYSQGSSLNFEIAADADLSDGLQVGELVGDSVVFELNAREVGTGRYHPPRIQLFSNGTGSLLNSNNVGGDNPQDGTPDEIDVDFGEEYVAGLVFDPATLTIAGPATSIPEPSSAVVGIIGGIGVGMRRRRKA